VDRPAFLQICVADGGIEEGGEIAFIDLGDAALVIPGGLLAR